MRSLPIAVLLVAGVGNAQPAAEPSLTFGAPGKNEPAGGVDAAILQRSVERSLNKLLDCYEKELRTTKGLQGTVTAQFTIDGKGAVSTSTATGLKNQRVESCIADVIKHLAFSKPKNGGSVVVSYPMMLDPESKKALFDEKNRKILDEIIDRQLQTRPGKFSGIAAPPMAKGSGTG